MAAPAYGATVEQVGDWLAFCDDRPIPLVPKLTEMFGLSAADGVAALGECNRILQQIDAAAEWLAGLPETERPHPIVPVLKERFGLTMRQTCAACRQAGEI